MRSGDTPQTADGDQAASDPARIAPQNPPEQVDADRWKTGLDDPRALQILTTEHWSPLSTRTPGYQEMFGRTTIFVAALSGTVVAQALVAQATHFGPDAPTFGRRRWMQLLLECADECGVPDDPEFCSARVYYLECGTRLAVIDSHPGADVPTEAPMPSWGWGVVGGPYLK